VGGTEPIASLLGPSSKGVSISNAGVLAATGGGHVNADQVNAGTVSGTSGDVITFGASNVLSDSGTLLTSLATGSGTANTMTKWTGSSALGNATMTDNGTTVTLGSGKTLDVSAATLKVPGSAFNACTPVGNASEATDTIGNQSVSASLQIFTATCGLSASLANYIDGTGGHHGVHVSVINDYTAPGSGATAIAEIGACPTVSVATHTCSANYVRLWSGAAVAPAAATAQAELFAWDILATGTSGGFVTSSYRTNAGIINNPAANVSSYVACGATCTGGAWSIVVGLTWSGTTSGTCNGVATNGNNCASMMGSTWQWIQ